MGPHLARVCTLHWRLLPRHSQRLLLRQVDAAATKEQHSSKHRYGIRGLSSWRHEPVMEELQLVRAWILEPDDIGPLRAVALTWAEPESRKCLRGRRIAHTRGIVLDHLQEIVSKEVTPEP